MKRHFIGTVILLGLLLPASPARSQNAPASGLYQITSGGYSECCGIGGSFNYTLPNTNQSFVRLTIDPQSQLATLTFLAPDARTVFSTTPCAAAGPISFTLGFGQVYSSFISFHADPGPSPYYTYWNYAVTVSANGLLINGTLGTAFTQCSDVPIQFTHSNVVAVPLPPPTLRITEFSSEGALLLVQGTAGQTNVIEASTNLGSWTPLNTNVMPPTLCPICPFIQFRDPASTNLPLRFYRTFEIW